MKATGHTALIPFQTTHKSLSKQTEAAQRQTIAQLCHGLTLDPGPKQRQSLHKRNLHSHRSCSSSPICLRAIAMGRLLRPSSPEPAAMPAVSFVYTGRAAPPSSLFGPAVRPVLHCRTARFARSWRPFCKAMSAQGASGCDSVALANGPHRSAVVGIFLHFLVIAICRNHVHRRHQAPRPWAG